MTKIENLYKQICDLSIRDTKTLSQKGLKAVEEVGELAKAILPIEGAHGTNHRCPNEDKITEECADTILVALSILIAMGKSPEQIITELSRKTDYWQFLIDNEDKADMDNLDFEIHITVSEAELEPFIQDCRRLGVKPIILDLYAASATLEDVMTSSTFRGSTTEVMRHTKQLAKKLREMGYKVVREKIETVPWHPAAQINRSRQSAYFEAHIAFMPDDRLSEFAATHDIHLSRNSMKKGADVVIMGTYRVDASKTNANVFASEVSNICQLAVNQGFIIKKKPHTEYSLWDTNEQHDQEWIIQ